VTKSDELSPYPGEDDPTDELPAYARLHRKYAPPLGRDHSIEDDIAAAGIEDRDPFAGFADVGPEAPEVLTPLADDEVDDIAIVLAPEAGNPPPTAPAAVGGRRSNRKK
jgi:hypothetical protein